MTMARKSKAPSLGLDRVERVAGIGGAGRPPNLVCGGSGHEVKTVMVAGTLLVRDGLVLTADEDAVRAEAQVQAQALAQRVVADPVHGGMALLAAMEARQL